jgi:hypothetical protein
MLFGSHTSFRRGAIGVSENGAGIAELALLPDDDESTRLSVNKVTRETCFGERAVVTRCGRACSLTENNGKDFALLEKLSISDIKCYWNSKYSSLT